MMDEHFDGEAWLTEADPCWWREVDGCAPVTDAEGDDDAGLFGAPDTGWHYFTDEFRGYLVSPDGMTVIGVSELDPVAQEDEVALAKLEQEIRRPDTITLTATIDVGDVKGESAEQLIVDDVIPMIAYPRDPVQVESFVPFEAPPGAQVVTVTCHPDVVYAPHAGIPIEPGDDLGQPDPDPEGDDEPDEDWPSKTYAAPLGSGESEPEFVPFAERRRRDEDLHGGLALGLDGEDD